MIKLKMSHNKSNKLAVIIFSQNNRLIHLQVSSILSQSQDSKQTFSFLKQMTMLKNQKNKDKKSQTWKIRSPNKKMITKIAQNK